MAGITAVRYKIFPLHTRLSNAYLIVGPQSLMLVDSGSPGDTDFIRSVLSRFAGRELALIYLTHAHYDHFGAAAQLSKMSGAPVAIHTADVGPCLLGETNLGQPRGRGKLARYGLGLLERFSPVPGFLPDVQLKGGETLDEYGFPARVLHTPGHTHGSTCLILSDGSVFAGDLVTTTGGPHPQRYYAQNWQELGESLAKLQEIRPRLVYPGHGKRPMTQKELLALKCC